MDECDSLAGRFESHRAHLWTMAYRILDELGFPGTRGFAGAFIYEGSHPFERGASSLSRFLGGGPAQRPCFWKTSCTREIALADLRRSALSRSLWIGVQSESSAVDEVDKQAHILQAGPVAHCAHVDLNL